jgi:3-hydroxybutyryl-CoA dehydrogenase
VSAIKTVGVVGCGTMGAGIAIVAARAGFKTIVYDTRGDALAAARVQSEAFFRKSVERGKLRVDELPDIMDRWTGTTRVEDLDACDVIIEAVFENLKVKHGLFAQLNKICPPHTIFASNTSTISITEIAAGSGRDDRVVGMHFCLPAQLMKLVEMSPGLNTSESTFVAAWEFCRALGQNPVKTKDSPGFILNYFLIPYNNDAIRLVEQGLAVPADIDKAMKTALGYAMGPFELLDLIGMDTQLLLCETLHGLTNEPRTACPPLVKRMIAAGHVGKKGGRGFYVYKDGARIAPPVEPLAPTNLRAVPKGVPETLTVREQRDVLHARFNGEQSDVERDLSHSITDTGNSRSFPGPHRLLETAVAEAQVVVILGSRVGEALERVTNRNARAVILVELGLESLGVHTGESRATEGFNVLGFARYRLGNADPTNLIELVRQPHTKPEALVVARALFERAGFAVAVCGDFPGRIVDRLIRPYFNAALRRLDEGLASADDIDTTLRLGLGYPEGPIALLERTGLAHHFDVSHALYEQLGDAAYAPARRARVAKLRESAG